MDIAYQGFGDDMDGDAYAIRRAVGLGLTVFVSNSFSKTCHFMVSVWAVYLSLHQPKKKQMWYLVN